MNRSEKGSRPWHQSLSVKIERKNVICGGELWSHGARLLSFEYPMIETWRSWVRYGAGEYDA